MKKLMTMLSAVALAFGVQAAGTWYSGTSFETMTAGQALDLTSGEGLMWATNGAPTLTVEDITSLPPAYAVGIRPEYFQESSITRALKVQTAFGNPVYRTNETVKTMGTLYVDALVKPTICEDDEISLDSGAKIAIWFKEIRDANDDPVSTNLMITAGYLTTSGSVSTNYDCGVFNAGADQWQRFTVKSFATIDSRSGYAVPGFVVYRNGALVTSAAAKGDSGVSTFNNLGVQAGVYYGKNGLFPSRVQSGDVTAMQQISAIGFDGTGSVDDILFSDDEPSWAAPFKTVTLTWDAHVTGFTYQVGTKTAVTKSGLAAAGTEVVAVENGDVISISDDTYATDYKQGDFDADDGITADSDNKTFSIDNYSTYVDGTAAYIVSMYDAPNVQIGDGTEHYTDLESAFGAINNKSGDVVVKINADGLTFPNGGLSLYGDNLTGVTLDLAGHTITYAGEGYALTASKPLTITNSTVTVGGITASQVVTSSDSLTIYDGVFSGAVTITAGDAAISGGTFNGAVSAGEGIEGFVTGGEFAVDYTLAGYIANGYKANPNGNLPPMYVVGLGVYKIDYYDGSTLPPSPYEAGTILPTNYTFGAATPVPAPTPTKEGYTFTGWSWCDSEGEPLASGYTPGETFGDLILVATWSANNYTVKFISGEGSTTQTVVKAYNATIAANEVDAAAAVAGKTFTAWDPAIEFPYTVTGDATYTAQYSVNSYTVKFISGEGSTTQEVVKAYNATIAANEVDAAAAVAGKTFTAWDPTIEFPYTVTADATFTAQYDAITYTVKFISGEGSTTQNVERTYGQTIADGVVTPAAVSGKNFTAWDPAISFPYTVTANATFTAQYASSGPAPIDPSTGTTEVPGASTDDPAVVAASVTVSVPAAATAAGVSSEAYQANFDKTAVYNTEKNVWEVTATIAEAKKASFSADVLDVLGGADKALTLPAGLYYKIETRSAIGGAVVNTYTSENPAGTATSISIAKPSTTQGFVTIEFSTTPFAVTP